MCRGRRSIVNTISNYVSHIIEHKSILDVEANLFKHAQVYRDLECQPLSALHSKWKRDA